MTNLECPHCHHTPDISAWNKSVRDAILLMKCKELIPEDLSREEWEEYRDDGGICDCPECGQPCCFEDMDAY